MSVQRLTIRQRGDTIVEVLLSILIISLVLAAAFAAANRGQNLTQRTDERALATGILEEQTERLRLAAQDPASAIYSGGGPWCIPDTLIAATGQCPAVGVPEYVVWVESAPSPDTYQVIIEWQRLGRGDGTETTERAANYYRVYPND